MMTKKKTRKVAWIKMLLTLPLTALLFFLFSCSQNDVDQVVQEESKLETEKFAPEDTFNEKEVTDKPIFMVVEDMPTFKGGDENKFRQWVQQNVTYPDIAVENGIQGEVHVQFVVEEDGTVSNVTITKAVDPSLDNEVIKVIKTCPPWLPGKQTGKTVRVKFDITVKFQLS